MYGSKAVGEPPLMLAFSVREALRQACAAFGPRRARRSTWPARPPRRPSTGPSTPLAPRRRHGGLIMDWLRAATQLRDAGEPGVLITVIAVRGHAPRDAGREDGRRVVADLGQHRRRQPRGGGHHPGPDHDHRASAARWSPRPPGSTRTSGPSSAGSAAAARSPCCSSRCRPGRRSRSSGSGTWATRSPGSCPAGTSGCSGRLPGRASSTRCGWWTSPTATPTSPCTGPCSARPSWSGCPPAPTC